jgi:hypothetical protein
MLCSRWSGRAGIQLVGEWSTRHGLLDHRGVAAQVEFEGKVLKQFSIFYFQALKPWALSTQVLILSTCTVLPPPTAAAAAAALAAGAGCGPAAPH